jgi:hypothetical protein
VTEIDPPLAELRRLLDDFADGAPFWPFWIAFMDNLDDFRPDRVLSPAGRAAYEAVCDLVYTAVPDPVAPADRTAGVIGESELRERLRDVRLESAAGRLV